MTVPTIVAGDESEPASLVSVSAAEPPAPLALPQLCLALIDFLASRRCQPMWGHEDSSAKVRTTRGQWGSCEDMGIEDCNSFKVITRVSEHKACDPREGTRG